MTTLPILCARALLLIDRIDRTDDVWLKANLQQDLDSTIHRIAKAPS